MFLAPAHGIEASALGAMFDICQGYHASHTESSLSMTFPLAYSTKAMRSRWPIHRSHLQTSKDFTMFAKFFAPICTEA
jgi:hypothetical protein